MATSRDIQEVIAKLSSDRAKPREEGIKLLNTWLEGERSIGFCRLLAKNTARIKPDEIPHAETWPFLITLLMKCVELEISGSKKRPPKLLIAKTLRTAIQCAEDPKFGGKLLLLSVVKQLFNHIWDVIKDVPNFHSEYSSVLRLLLAVKEYRYQMRKRVYCCLVVLYMKKVVMSISIKTNTQFSSKEELFRHILTFHVLLENPPGDFPSNIMDDIVGGFIEIFSNIRDEGKISRKLMDCINTYLIKDGPNLGCQAFEIHSSIQEFMMRCWLTTHDRGLKNSFIIYARIQLKLNRSLPEGSLLIEQFLDVVAKELDQGSVAGTCTLWNDTSRDEKVGSFGSTQKGLMELAAAVFYQACTNGSKKLLNEKRLKMEDATVRLKDALMKGSWLWNGAFSFLIRNYGNCMNKSLLIDWFEVACQSLQRILNNSVTSNSYEALLWLLRALQELSPILVLPNLKESSKDQLLTSDEAVQIRNNWNVVSTSLMHSLPTFSNATPVVDAALVLLGNMIVREQAGAAAAPQDMWDLMIFKQKPSRSALYFISCYFSRKSVQGDLRDALHIRRSLLRVTMELVNFEEPICLSEDDVTLIPAAVFSLCAGSVANLPNSGGMTYLSEENKEKVVFLAEGDDQKFLAEVIECSVEALSAMENGSIEVKLEQHHGIRLPQQVKQPLIHEMEDYIATLVASEECVKKLMLADLVNFCSLLCNWIYISIFVRLNEMKPACMTKMHDFVSKLLDLIACKVEEKCNEIKDCAFVGLSSVFDASGASVSAFQCLLSCPLFSLPKESTSNYELLEVVIRSTENILAALTKLYAVVSSYASASNSEIRAHGISPSSFTYLPGFSPMDESGAQIVDMDLDIDDGSKNAESFGAGGSNKVVSFSPSQWKLKLVSIISAFFSLSPPLTWQTLFDMIEKENDDKVSENILYNLCKYFHGSAGSFSSLVSLVINIMGTNVGVKLYSVNILSAIHALLATLLSISSRSKLVDDVQYSRITVPEENLSSLAGLVNEVAETGLPDWFARITLIDCICNFVLLEPHVAQVMIGRLLALLQDTDYRVRLFLAKKVGILFQTWDGHDELFHDICSNFGFYMVRTSKEKLIKAKDVLTCGPPSMLVMETALITLAHLALYSEEIENEAVFMICVVAAIDPSQRKLTYALLDNLSQQLKYPSRTKYLDELIGSIIARWVACEVSLLALTEVQDLFVNLSEPKLFMLYCCPWLLPPLILKRDFSSLNWVSKVNCFSFPELERDELIKKNMVSIISFLLSLTSSCADPEMPSFTKDTVVLSVQTIVDGFFEMDESPKTVGVVDKINIFRPDRVFKFLVEIHYQITIAIHPRHKCHRLSAIEALIQIIGHRATVSSTSNYIFNILGQLIDKQSLQDQCCRILSTLLEVFKVDCKKDVICVLGEQLQFLVSKLVACCIPSVNKGGRGEGPSSRVITLLHQLTVDADISLSDYIRELEPFPEIDCLERMRKYHEELCKTYTSRDRFLMFVRRSLYLPKGLLPWSLRALHRNLREIVFQETSVTNKYGDGHCWSCDPEVVTAVWNLVHLCNSSEADDMSGLLADFISRVGIGDPYRVVFHLPGDSTAKHLLHPSSDGTSKEAGFCCDTSVSEEVVVTLLKLLKKFLSDDSAKTVDLTSRTLKGILSTDRGQGALLHLTSFERSVIAVHSKGANLQVVEKLLLDSPNSGNSNIAQVPFFSSARISSQMAAFHTVMPRASCIELGICILSRLLTNVYHQQKGYQEKDRDWCYLVNFEVPELDWIHWLSMTKALRNMTWTLTVSWFHCVWFSRPNRIHGVNVPKLIFFCETLPLNIRFVVGLLFEEGDIHGVVEFSGKRIGVAFVSSMKHNSLTAEKKYGNDISLDDSSLWCTSSKTYDTWICLLVHSLIGFCNDIILRLCQDIVLLKSEVAELLFANVLVDLAGKKFDFCKPISTKVEENIFSKSNNLIKSVQLLLSAMNSLRSFYATEKARSTPTTARNGKPSSSTKSRGTSEKLKERSVNSSPLSSLWEKVYWLSIDYLVVAEAAIRCGSYFTAIMYVEHWCEEQFNGLTLGCPDFSHKEQLPQHIELLVGAVTQINEPDSVYGIIQSHKLKSQLVTCEHEGNWSKALEYYDLLVRFPAVQQPGSLASKTLSTYLHFPHGEEDKMSNWKCYKGLMRSLQKTGCTHVLDTYGHGLTSQIGYLQNDSEFTELQYEAAWRAGNWDFSLFTSGIDSQHSRQYMTRFNESLHSCLRALQEGDAGEFCTNLTDSKKELVLSISNTSRESTEHIYSTIVRLQMLDHLGMAWDLHWKPVLQTEERSDLQPQKKFLDPIIPTKVQMESLDAVWSCILRQAQLHMNLLEPFIAFRRVMLQILGCKESMAEHLLQSASTLRKGSRFSLATAALHELKQLLCQPELQTSHVYFLGRLEEAKVLRAQGQHEMAISLARYILSNYQMRELASSVYRLVGKWLAETCSSNSRTILEQYLKHSVELIESNKSRDRTCMSRQCQTYFQLAHYTDGLFKSYEERLASNEWQAAMRLRKHKTKELDALIRRLKGSTKGDKTDYSIKIQELQKQLTMDREEAEKLEDDRDSFLSLALEGYEHCLVIGGKYDLRVVFRLVSLWFSLYTRQSVVKAMHSTVKEVQSYKFIPLVYQIASRLGSSKDGQGSNSFQLALVSLLKKMAIDHPYHTLFQLLALANGDRIKDKQRSRNSFIVDMDKKLAAENLLNELSAHHGAILRQMKQMVEIYIKLAELETKKEETNKRIPLPRDVRSLRQLELVPVVTANIPVDHSCQYKEGSFPHFSGLADSVMVMNGINAPKVIECFGSDGRKYRQLAKSGNDDLRQDAVMEQFFGLVNTFLQNHRDTWRRKLGIRTYKVVPFTPSAGVLEWVDRTIPLGEYLLGSSRNGGAHARYGIGDWSFLQCREHMANEKDKRKAFLRVCDNFRPVMHHFFLERFLQPADWFERRLSYTRSVAASSMVGYIVGLGDRHSMNILIDQATAEVVHIDLGVAFEQGLMLKTPERVPFRLTRDVIDGMGITGVEGVFRRCCEETLSVMRTNKEALLTIIEVFIHDPLYKWALSPLKALQRQKETDYDTGSSMEGSQDAYEGNKDAARATLRVKQKLDGYEDGEMRSVQGQVQQLIQDAIDTDRLCQMFPGWGAWL
ncbi:serine/threonine-protein kinase ATM [Asparagus officinalis]|uniref:serine/threonine-protein kinase ATM n=1 Tax=Asparagus officinalis TaxID=4686 RepID=UPI00098E719F|nr:serine/threonine-protein kinase ATM [Asparagus officinalis]